MPEGSALDKLIELVIERGITVSAHPCWNTTSPGYFIQLGPAPAGADAEAENDKPTGEIGGIGA